MSIIHNDREKIPVLSNKIDHQPLRQRRNRTGHQRPGGYDQTLHQPKVRPHPRSLSPHHRRTPRPPLLHRRPQWRTQKDRVAGETGGYTVLMGLGIGG